MSARGGCKFSESLLRYRFTPSPTRSSVECESSLGHMLVCEAEPRTFVTVYLSPHHSRAKSDEEVRDDLVELYKQSMKRHLLSDVPVDFC